ncbi:Protein of unknown function [Pyronema omphalodes CBS 100304]|uniref:Uncharacterized protein n=1 Tax=Pyronema omphalodes (strain CBS 100304) TaxID=1076935 RepID=U4L894_PYROM|nr:Protein of unknown function [Pyronema omphalodes CBS 100304]
MYEDPRLFLHLALSSMIRSKDDDFIHCFTRGFGARPSSRTHFLSALVLVLIDLWVGYPPGKTHIHIVVDLIRLHFQHLCLNHCLQTMDLPNLH